MWLLAGLVSVAMVAAGLQVPALASPPDNDADDASIADGDADAQPDEAVVRRVAGADRFATAGALAQRVDGDTLWVATGFDFADALTAGATGAGPVLLTAGDSAPDRTLDAAAQLSGIERVRAVGGPGAVADAAVQAVADAAGVADVARVSGAHRFATAAEVSRRAHPDGASVAYVATGLAFPDALTASAAAADQQAPVLLAAGDTLPEATRTELARLDPGEVVIVGGEAAVGPEVEAELADVADEVSRVAGDGRFATAAAVSQHRGIAAEEAFLATGEDFPDVLAAAPAAISADAALLLTGQGVLPEPTGAELDRVDVARVTIAGGESAVSLTVANEIRRRLGAESEPRGEITMARANWDTGFFQAEVYYQLLTELGYDVEHPSENEFGPQIFYSAVDGRDVDFWANGWFPLHDDFFADTHNATKVGTQAEAGAFQGYLMDRATYEEHGFESIEQIAEDPDNAEVFDFDGDGKGDLVGCPPGWGCHDSIAQHFAEQGFEANLNHIDGEYAAMITDAIARIERGEPALLYTWTPNWTIAELVPGEDVVWIEAPTHPDGQDPVPGGAVPGGPDACVADPCDIGWTANDIQVVANNDFLAEEPAAEALFEQVNLDVFDISEQNALMQAGEDAAFDIERHAQEWIEANRDTVDGWLEAARRADR